MGKGKPIKEFMIGVDIGGTKILAAVIDPTGKILASEKMRTYADRGVSAVVGRIAECVQRALAISSVSLDHIAAIGVGAPGPMNQETGILEKPPNLTGWVNVPLKTLLQQHIGLPVYLENDANAGAYGEFKMGAGIGMQNVLGIFIGTGIGAGLIINGSLYHGFNHTAGEIGHLVLNPKGPKCGCGMLGCFEAYASRTAVVKRIAEIAEKKSCPCPILEEARETGQAIRSSAIRKGWEQGDACVKEALEEMVNLTATVLGSMINLLSPQMIILGGGLIESLGHELTPRIEEIALQKCFPEAGRNVQIRSAALGDDAGILGAAFLASERVKRKNGNG